MKGPFDGGPFGGDGDRLRYDKMVENALRGVIRAALVDVAENGLPGAHHFYVTFDTNHPDVDIPDYLRGEYPGAMTIVIQHQYWGLAADDEGFEITLSFRKVHERLRVPWPAVTAFADPSVSFALQFEAQNGGGDDGDPAAESPQADAPIDEEPKTGDVVTVDFRKKKTT